MAEELPPYQEMLYELCRQALDRYPDDEEAGKRWVLAWLDEHPDWGKAVARGLVREGRVFPK